MKIIVSISVATGWLRRGRKTLVQELDVLIGLQKQISIHLDEDRRVKRIDVCVCCDMGRLACPTYTFRFDGYSAARFLCSRVQIQYTEEEMRQLLKVVGVQPHSQ